MIINNIDKLDLNLVRVFVAVFEEKSATMAAQRLSLTQSAISASIRKLRLLYQDSLFIRTGRGLRPSLFAQQLYPLVKESLERLSASMKLQSDQQIMFAGRTITIGLSDDFEIALGQRLSELAQQIPNCSRLHFQQSNTSAVSEMLLSRSIDLAITAGGFSKEGISFTHIGEGTYGCLLDPDVFGYPDELSFDMFLDHEHVMVSRSGFFGIVDDVLANMGYRRRIRASTSHFSALPYLLTGTNCLSILPRHAAKYIAKVTRLAYYPCPIEFPKFSVGLAWRNFSRSDKVLQGLIELYKEKLKTEFD